jgi:mono/diheme cytochrome c family protein
VARRTIAGLGLLVLFGACAGSIDEGDQVAGLTPAQRLAQDAWLKKALPAFKDGTCITCHDGSMAPTAPPYLVGAKDLDIRDTVVAYIPSVVSLGSPRVSRVVVKGMHEGPAMSAPNASAIVEWLTYEHDARPPAMVIQTAQMSPMMCVGNPGDATCPANAIDLGAVGSAGSNISFYVTPLGPDLYLTQLKVTAGPGGLHLVHPVFETWPTGMMDPTPDPVDPYFNVTLNLAPAASADLGAGNLTLTNFMMNPLSVKFDELSDKM